MRIRQWYPQLDVFDTVRRYTALLSRWGDGAPTRERLFVSDFYLVNPSLLHDTRMTSEARKAFSLLQIPRSDKVFIKLPSAAVLYNKMAGIQSKALHNMLGRGLCDLAAADAGLFKLSAEGLDFARRLDGALMLPREAPIIEFLATTFLQVGGDKGGLRAATGLMRIGA